MTSTEYMREYRARTPARRERDRWWVRTRARALEQLAREYPERFGLILEKIRKDQPGPWMPDPEELP